MNQGSEEEGKAERDIKQLKIIISVIFVSLDQSRSVRNKDVNEGERKTDEEKGAEHYMEPSVLCGVAEAVNTGLKVSIPNPLSRKMTDCTSRSSDEEFL